MKINGIRLTILGLIIGLAVGLGAQYIKSTVRDELVSLLSEEARISTGCEFKVDKINVALLTLSATVKRPRIECAGHSNLYFESIRAKFRLASFKKKRVWLDLFLNKGHAEQVDEDSIVTRFITSLAAPPPPERSNPDKWKIKLRRLRVSNSSFAQNFGEFRIEGGRSQILMVRDERNNFNIYPEVEQLDLVTTDLPIPNRIRLGAGTSEVYLGDDDVTISKVEVRSTAGTSLIKGLVPLHAGNSTSFAGDFTLNSNKSFLSELLGGAFSGALNYTHKDQKGIGQAKIVSTSAVDLHPFSSIPKSKIDRFESSVKFNRGTPEDRLTEIDSLIAEGENISLSLIEPFKISADQIKGVAKVKLSNFAVADKVTVSTIGSISLSGTNSQISVDLGLDEISLNGFALGPLAISIVRGSGATLLLRANSINGRNTINGESLLVLRPEIRVERANLAIKELPLWGGSTINGSIALSGDIEPIDLAGTGSITISKGQKRILNSGIAVNGTDINFKILPDSLSGLTGSAKISLAKSEELSVNLKANNPDLSVLSSELSCISLDSEIGYRAILDHITEGDGQVSINGLSLGCAPYLIGQDKSQKFQITNGRFKIPEFKLSGDSSTLKVSLSGDLNGNFSGESSATLDLNTLLSLLPSLDHLSGRADANVSFNGDLNRFNLSGRASLYDGEIELEDGVISARDIDGKFVLEPGGVRVETLTGQVNGGALDASGRYLFSDLSKSSLSARLSNATINPSENSTIQSSALLTLRRGDDGLPLLAGEISLISGELRESFDLLKLVRDYALGLFSTQKITTTQSSSNSPISLDLKISGDRNLYLITNVADGEFAVDLSVKGSIDHPLIEGDISTLSGWVGLKNRRFDISSGHLTFNKISNVPNLDILAEATFPATSGELVLVFLEVSGPLNNPKFSLSSDLPYTEDALLALITQSGVGTTSTRANSRMSVEEQYSAGLLEDFASLNLARFVRGLTSLDSLGIEPIYNPFSGLVEPAFVAEKRLAKRLRLQGESTLSSVTSLSRARLVFDLFPNVSLWGSIQSDPTKNNPPIEGNIAFTALARQPESLTTSIIGNNKYSNDRILEHLRITSASRLRESGLTGLISRLRDFYISEGFLEVGVNALCPTTDSNEICRELLILISEGPRISVDSLVFEGESPSGKISDDSLRSITRFKLKQPATAQFLDSRIRELTTALRSEGYLQTRVSGRFSEVMENDTVNLILKIGIGNPITFEFEGNQAFSDIELLNSLGITTRKQPFGNNAPSVLLRNIETMYRKAGYLFATAYYDIAKDTERGRDVVRFKITEESRVPVTEVRIANLIKSSLDAIKAEVSAIDSSSYPIVFKPQFAINEEIQVGSNLITQALIQLGFPFASTHGEILIDKTGESATIEYSVLEGDLVLVPEIKVSTLNPGLIDIIPAPPSNCTTQVANLYIERVKDLLLSNGYRNSSVTLSNDKGSYNLEIVAGVPTYVSKVTFAGSTGLSQDRAKEIFAVKDGDIWNSNRIAAGKRRLLSSGLFSRVEIAASDGALDSQNEALSVTLSERPSQTFEFGFGANSEYGFHLFNEASDRTFFGDGRSLALRLDGYYQPSDGEISQGVANLRYHDPLFNSDNWSHTEDLRFQRLDLNTLPYDLDRVLLSSAFNWSDSSGTTFNLGHLISEENLDNVAPDAIIGEFDTGSVVVSAITAGFSLDRRDSPLNPSRGFLVSVEGKLASDMLGSEASFAQFSLRASKISKLSDSIPEFTFAIASNIGVGDTFSGTDQIPISFRYFTGGRTTVRGFKENSLGTKGSDGSPIGGDLLIGANSELRYELTNSVESHLFFDAGSVFLGDTSPSYEDLRYSTGVGFRYRSPIGPIGIDVGTPLDRETGESPYRIHFSIGSMF